MYQKEKYTMTHENGLFYEKTKVWAIRDSEGKLIKSFYQKAAALRLLTKLEETEENLFRQHERFQKLQES